MISGNLVLIQAQALVVGFLAAVFAMVMGWIPQGKWNLEHGFILCASSMLTASLASLVLGKSRNFYMTSRCVGVPPSPLFIITQLPLSTSGLSLRVTISISTIDKGLFVWACSKPPTRISNCLVTSLWLPGGMRTYTPQYTITCIKIKNSTELYVILKEFLQSHLAFPTSDLASSCSSCDGNCNAVEDLNFLVHWMINKNIMKIWHY